MKELCIYIIYKHKYIYISMHKYKIYIYFNATNNYYN